METLNEKSFPVLWESKPKDPFAFFRNVLLDEGFELFLSKLANEPTIFEISLGDWEFDLKSNSGSFFIEVVNIQDGEPIIDLQEISDKDFIEKIFKKEFQYFKHFLRDYLSINPSIDNQKETLLKLCQNIYSSYLKWKGSKFFYSYSIGQTLYYQTFIHIIKSYPGKYPYKYLNDLSEFNLFDKKQNNVFGFGLGDSEKVTLKELYDFSYDNQNLIKRNQTSFKEFYSVFLTENVFQSYLPKIHIDCKIGLFAWTLHVLKEEGFLKNLNVSLLLKSKILINKDGGVIGSAVYYNEKSDFKKTIDEQSFKEELLECLSSWEK